MLCKSSDFSSLGVREVQSDNKGLETVEGRINMCHTNSSKIHKYKYKYKIQNTKYMCHTNAHKTFWLLLSLWLFDQFVKQKADVSVLVYIATNKILM